MVHGQNLVNTNLFSVELSKCLSIQNGRRLHLTLHLNTATFYMWSSYNLHVSTMNAPPYPVIRSTSTCSLLPWHSFVPPWMEVARIPLSQWNPFALMESSSLPQKPRTTWNDALPAARSDGNYECLPGFAYVNRLGDLVDPLLNGTGVYTWVYIIGINGGL